MKYVGLGNSVVNIECISSITAKSENYSHTLVIGFKDKEGLLNLTCTDKADLLYRYNGLLEALGLNRVDDNYNVIID